MNKKWLLGGGVLAAVLVAAGVWFMFFKDDAPDAVSNDAANDQLTADLDTLDATTDTAEPAGDDDTVNETTDDSQPTVDDDGRDFDGSIDGTWVVNNEIGEFDFDTASGSFAGFRVAEESPSSVTPLPSAAVAERPARSPSSTARSAARRSRST